MNFDDSIERNSLYSSLIILGANPKLILQEYPSITTHQLTCLVSGLVKLDMIYKQRLVYNDLKSALSELEKRDVELLMTTTNSFRNNVNCPVCNKPTKDHTIKELAEHITEVYFQ